MRARLALRLAAEASQQEYPLVVVDGGSPAEFTNALASEGAVVRNEERSGMGESRRQAMRAAGTLAGADGVVAWIEPEKAPLIGNLKPALGFFDRAADLVVPARTQVGFASYPPEQIWAEWIGNLTFAQIAGVKLDAWFGPKIMGPRALRHFLAYPGIYGDEWESLLVPVLSCIKEGLTVASAQVSYMHPPEQTASERTFVMTMKRIEQLRQILPALGEAALRLGFPPVP